MILLLSREDHLSDALAEEKYGGTPDLPFSGVAGFARLPHAVCLEEPGRGFDIAVLGMPFDVSRASV